MTNSATVFHHRIFSFFRMIKFSHTLFALPFALMGVLFAHRDVRPVTWYMVFWVVLAMFGARTAAMGFNRIADLAYDRKNPRTSSRELVTGEVSLNAAWFYVVFSSLLFFLSCYQLNLLCLLLSPLALGLAFFYSFTKRFTCYSHFFLGLVLAIAPVGGWAAVAGSLSLFPFLLGAGVLFWVSGFDLLYSLQDRDFDLETGLYSMAVKFPPSMTLMISRFLHLIFIFLFFSISFFYGLGASFLFSLFIVTGILFYEHWLVRGGRFENIPKAFFQVNAWVGVVLFLGAALA